MGHSKPVRLETAPTGVAKVLNRTYRGAKVYLFLEFTIVLGFLAILFEKSQPGDRTYSEASGFGDPSYRRIMVDFRIT